MTNDSGIHPVEARSPGDAKAPPTGGAGTAALPGGMSVGAVNERAE
jgi:hypothetical protein